MANILIYILFGLSGFFGLIYEGLWAHYLKLLFGHSAYGQIFTLVCLLGGIGIGSFIGGRISQKTKCPLKGYAVVELGIGLCGLTFHTFFLKVMSFYLETLAANISSAGLLLTFKILCGLVVTLPAAILMGMTFPFVAAALIRRSGDSGKSALPLLYFVNSLGGALGILAASFFFIRKFGTPGTLAIAGMGNCVLALIFMGLSKRYDAGAEKESSKKENVQRPTVAVDRIWVWLLLAAMTGLTSFINEVSWIRLLSLVLGSATHSFDIMVSAFILGLAFGSLFCRVLIRQFHQHLKGLLITAQVAMGICALSTIYFYDYYFNFVNVGHAIFLRTFEGYVAYGLYKYGVALAVMFPMAFFAGMTLPLITHYLVRESGSEKYTGYIYGWNALGCILGAGIAGLFLLPVLQLKGAIAVGGILDLMMGWALLFIFAVKTSTRWKTILLSGLMAVFFTMKPWDPAVLSSGVFRYAKKDASLTQQRTLVLRHGRTATGTFGEDEKMQYISTNGKSDGAIPKAEFISIDNLADHPTMAMLAYLPIQMMHTEYKAAIIGMGTGMTLHHMLGDPQLQQVDLIEIEKEMIGLAENFRPSNERAYTDSRVNYIIDDAKSFFYSNGKKYDVIISEPSNPWVSGVAGLFTQEFYQHVKKFVSDDGVFVQWLHTYEFNDSLMLSVLTALTEFPHFELYSVPYVGGADIIIVASHKPIATINSDRILKNKNLADPVAQWGLPMDSFGGQQFIASQKTLAPLLAFVKGVANSDYYPYLDQHSELGFYLREKSMLVNRLIAGGSYFQQIYEGERFSSRLKLASGDSLFSSTKAEETEALIQSIFSAKATSDWSGIEDKLFGYLAPRERHGLYTREMPVVVAMKKQISEGHVPADLAARMNLFDSFASKGSAAQIVGHVREVIHTHDANSLAEFHLREIFVLAYLHGDFSLMNEIMSKYGSPENNNVNSYDRAIMLDALHRKKKSQAAPVVQ